MYTSEKSTRLTLYITYGFMVLLSLLMIFCIPLIRLFFGDIMRDSTFNTLVTAFYCCTLPAWAALGCIVKILRNILSDEVFTKNTVGLLRYLSWCCALVSLICFISGLIYVPLLIFALGAAFMTLILRVLKSVMAKATQLKEENELTI